MRGSGAIARMRLPWFCASFWVNILPMPDEAPVMSIRWFSSFMMKVFVYAKVCGKINNSHASGTSCLFKTVSGFCFFDTDKYIIFVL